MDEITMSPAALEARRAYQRVNYKQETTLTISPELVRLIETALSQGKELKIKRNSKGEITVLDITAKRIF